MHYSIDLKDIFHPGHSLMKANSLPLNTSILKDKARVLRWRDLTLPIQIPHICQARSNSPSADTDDKRLCISRGWDVEASNWSVHYILMDRVDLPTKPKIKQLTFSWVLRLTSFFFYFQLPILFSNNIFHFPSLYSVNPMKTLIIDMTSQINHQTSK